MSKKQRTLVALPLVGGLCLMAVSAHAQVGGGTWKTQSPSFNVQERGCGDVSDLTFKLTCSSAVDNRAERRYATHGSGTWQFEGSFRITSMSGTRLSLKQTFKDDPGAGPYWMLGVENGGRLYLIRGSHKTLGGEGKVGATVRVNTIHTVGSRHEVYINGSKRDEESSPSGNFYDKLGLYRSGSGKGPGTVVWSGIKFWKR